MPRIRHRAIIKEIHKSGLFRCCLEDNETHEVIAKTSGRMTKRQITLCVGDEVDIELSKYDLTRGRIVWRHQTT